MSRMARYACRKYAARFVCIHHIRVLLKHNMNGANASILHHAETNHRFPGERCFAHASFESSFDGCLKGSDKLQGLAFHATATVLCHRLDHTVLTSPIIYREAALLLAGGLATTLQNSDEFIHTKSVGRVM